jgi:hypothetical protein
MFLKHEMYINIILKFISHHTENTKHLHFNDQFIINIFINDVFNDTETYKFSVWGKYKVPIVKRGGTYINHCPEELKGRVGRGGQATILTRLND